jgi:hypothetical protein
MSAATATTAGETRAFKTIVYAGLTCGVMDISAAFITWYPKGISPERVLQGVASGWVGRDAALSGGAQMAAVGLATHFFIAFTWATIFYIASRKVAFLTQKAVISGITYGVFVYGVMYWIVRPLSNVPHGGAFSWFNTIIAVLTHMVCVGLPIALVTARIAPLGRTDAID